ncbi:coenzyme F420-dependent NADP oxidoreductase [Sphaerulina musiva SO2202]|uniref:Coenzyme F420-dependent NADP oxidoreductase n=1 Tax=Sphaerulina musiva (strain SO2202) TaxID=692275 RepID=M3CEX9_SPHMS|nr:coenzyme F420-dependent NADP oxidoreductase [Sphaerulina musiva SO2202]EMF11591.1 coenzyme F420-dependent NADP oxidoreductase [Sphaerulina musiva SO2202]
MAVGKTAALGEIGSGTLAILGCGALGTAILLGLLSDSLDLPGVAKRNDGQNGWSKAYRFVACVRREQAADTIRQKVQEVAPKASSLVDIQVCNNVEAIRTADIVLLAVQPHLLAELLQEPHMSDSLRGKIIISVLAGVTVNDIQSAITMNLETAVAAAAAQHTSPLELDSPPQKKNTYTIVRAMPNINCFAGQSTTIIERDSSSSSSSSSSMQDDNTLHLVSNLFHSLGKVFFTSPSTMNACTALCGSTPAFFTIVLEGLIEGAIAAGLKPDEALQMLSHTMMGTGALMMSQGGRDPAAVRHQVTSPGGSTIRGVLSLEENRVRWSFARALEISAAKAGDLGGSSSGSSGSSK